MSVSTVHQFFFLLKSGLDDHFEQTHSEFRMPNSPEWQYCTYRACKLAFRKEQLLNKHMLSIHGENTKKRKQLEGESEEKDENRKVNESQFLHLQCRSQRISKKINVDRDKNKNPTLAADP